MVLSKWFSLLVLVAVLSPVASARAALLVIDDFSLPGPAMVALVTPGTSPHVVQQNSASGVIGGQRDIRMSVDSGVGGSSIFLVGSDLGKNQFGANTVAQRTSTVQLQYDGNDAEAGQDLIDAKGLFVDLTDSGKNNELLIRFANSQVPGSGLLNLYVEITSDDGMSYYTGTKANNLIGAGGVPLVEDHIISLGSFVGDADLTQVQSITFRFNDDGTGVGSVGADFQIELIATVPEPGSVALLGSGLGATIAGLRRRRRR